MDLNFPAPRISKSLSKRLCGIKHVHPSSFKPPMWHFINENNRKTELRSNNQRICLTLLLSVKKGWFVNILKHENDTKVISSMIKADSDVIVLYLKFAISKRRQQSPDLGTKTGSLGWIYFWITSIIDCFLIHIMSDSFTFSNKAFFPLGTHFASVEQSF